MNCTECRDNLVACAEGLLNREESLACQTHLESCPDCRAEYQAIASLQQRLVARSQAAAGVSIVQPVMRRVLQEQTRLERNTIMSMLRKYRWGFGLGAVASTAAVVIAVVVATSPKAFGLEQVIEAYNRIRFLHIKDFQPKRSKSQAPSEFWIQSNDQGQVEKARYYFPETEDGAKLITWTPERAEIWFQSKHGFLIYQTKRIAPWMQSLLDQSQPQLVLKKLQEAQRTGEVEVDIQEQPGTSEPGVIVVTHKAATNKEIYRIDPKTDLISQVEYYRIQGTNEVLESRMEFCDYNVPIAEKMFSLQPELPPDVTICDQLNQLTGVAQGKLTDEQAAAETVRQFFQALLDKDYKQAGLIYSGEVEEYVKKELGEINIARIISVGPAQLQTNWEKRGYRVPSQLEIIQPDGQKTICLSGPYVRPGDDEAHPDRWNITGGVDFTPILPDNAKYAQMTAKQAAEVFFKACAEQNWDEVQKFWPMPNADDHFARMKEYLGGLEVISIGEPYQSDQYPGWYVPYEIKLQPQEFNVRVSNDNPAKRYVITGIYDRQLHVQQELKWMNAPALLPDNDAYARLSPAEAVKNYFDAASKFNWDEMRKFAPDYDVENDKAQIEAAEKRGADVHNLIPTREVVDAFWSAEQSAWFVKCRMVGIKKWNLAIRNDNPAGRWMFDGGL